MNPLTNQSTLAAIRARFAEKLPLNISAVKSQAPGLLEGLWQPANFVGWRQMMDAAGVNYHDIRFVLEPHATCPICGFQAEILTRHVNNEHSLTAKDLRKDSPTVELMSEEYRSTVFSKRGKRAAKSIAPHWEKAWSMEYALDRVRWLYDQGKPVNLGAIHDGEPGLGAYLLRIFGTWDRSLEACGLDPGQVRMSEVARSYTREEILQNLRSRHPERTLSLHISRCRVPENSALFTCIFREFHSLEAAMVEAGIDPLPLIPALSDAAMLERRVSFISAVHARVRAKVDYDAEEVAGFIKEHQAVVEAFWSGWPCVALSLNYTEKEMFNHPARSNYVTQEGVVRAIRQRARLGMPIREALVRTDNPLLVQAAILLFEKHWDGALKAAKVELAPAGTALRQFTPDGLITFLQEMAAQTGGLPGLVASAKQPGCSAVYKWATKFFGSWKKALAAAGLLTPPVTRLPKTDRLLPQRVRYPGPESVIAAIQARAAAGKSVMLAAVHQTKPKDGDVKLVVKAREFFGGWTEAVLAAGLIQPGERASNVRYGNKNDVIQELQRRHAAGIGYTCKALTHGEHKDITLRGAMGRYFDSSNAAVQAAGLPVVSLLGTRVKNKRDPLT